MVATANADAWQRFQAMLAAMHSGDLVTIEEIVCETGIGAVSARRVLDTLAHAQLFEQRGVSFVRLQGTERWPTGGPIPLGTRS
jgi:hypothetical protein